MIQSLYHPKHGSSNTNTHNIQQQQLTGQQMEHEIVNVQESHRNNFWKLQKIVFAKCFFKFKTSKEYNEGGTSSKESKFSNFLKAIKCKSTYIFKSFKSNGLQMR